MSESKMTPTMWARRELYEHEWRMSGDNDWWHGYLTALRGVLEVADAADAAEEVTR